MAALDLSAPSTLPLVAWTATPGTANLVRLITLPTSGQYQVIVHNRDKASKGLYLSTDQTLTDGGAAPANTYITIDNQWTFTVGDNRTTGRAPITKLGVFSISHTAVNIEILINEIR
jgi:hypothetical protein